MGAGIEALRSGGKRVKIHDAQAVFKLPKAVKKLVVDIAKKGEESEADVYRAAVAEYLDRRGYRL